MPVRASIDPKYLWRLGLAALAFLGTALWFLYDGKVTYPRQRQRALKYLELEEKERLGEWEEIAKQRGWPLEDPGEPKEEVEIQVQLIIAALASVPGLLFAFFFIRTRGRWIEVSESGLCTSWGRQLEFGQIISLDKKKWKSKGIAKISYRQNGRKRRVVLDDWKYHFDPTKAILREVESRLDASQIVGGLPEPPAEDEPDEPPADGAPPSNG